VILFVYLEQPDAGPHGPFFRLSDAMDCPLWEHPRSCVWMFEHTARGWNYEHVKWCGDHWLTTSRGLRPLEPVAPESIEREVAAFAAGCGAQRRAGRTAAPFLVHTQRN
jgi:hypothetical protein